MDVGDWLRSLGLGQYEALFRENEIDAEVLPELTDADLEKIGVPLGHRKRLLKAIANFGAAEAPAKPTIPQPAASSRDVAERRPITVMFCDLVGSTSLAAKLDPEDWRNLVGSYLDAASAAVTSLGGHVLKKLGDGLMALFGYPQAQENDGERAVRAALAIQRALADLNARNAATAAPELSARIGLESGRVVVDSSGEVYGDAPNIAARVQSAAAPGEIWITLGVHRQIAGLFVAEDKGEHELKGVPEKMQLYRIVRASGGGRRGGSRAPTPLVGRAEELDILMRRWERARRGEGQLSLIVGEPGLGKSRLIEEFRARLAETPHTWVEWASSQLLQNTPLHPVAEWGRVRFGGADVVGERQYAELEAALGSVGLDAGEYAPLLAPVIDAPTPPGRAPKLSPEELRSRQLAALAAWVLAGARTQPIVLAFEDLHWADPTSLDVLQALAERGGQAPLLIVATTRPEFRPPWKLRSHHGVISLAPLDAGEIVRMVGEIATRHALSKDVIAGVSERTGGVPLFIEEVTRLLLERGEQGGVQAIPPTLQQSLAARLDRLGSAREIAQIGAVLGRGFSHALLQAVAGLDEPALRAALDRLVDAELLFVEGIAPHANYRFKHALIQDAAYDSLLKSRRQTLHRRAAEVLLASPSPEAEALAHHFTQAGQTDLAIEWWGKAGDQALRRSAFAEAISHLGRAIELSDKAGDAARPREAATTASARQRLKLQTDYGQAVMWSKGFAAEETKAAFTRVGELATEIGDAEALGANYFARWIHSFWRGELGAARTTAENFLREMESKARPTEEAAAHRCLGMSCLFQGDFAQARSHFEQTLRIYDPERDREARYRFGQDSDVGATAFLAHAAWRLGDVGRARELIDEADARAAESAHAPTLANTYIFKTIFEVVRDDAEAALRAAEGGVALSREHGLEHYSAFGSLASAWGRSKLGDRDAGSTGLRQALAEYAGQGNKFLLPLFQGLLAEIEAEGRGAEAALAGIDGALALARETGEHWFDAGLHRIRGEILIKQNPADPAPAEAAFLAAIAVAQQQKARSFELRAALSLAKLYRTTGLDLDAHAVLGSALEGFAPTPEFPQIAEAKALFEALAQTDQVTAAAAAAKQRVPLQIAMGNALIAARGYGAAETKAAFERANEFVAAIKDADQRFSVRYGLWVGSYVRDELGSMREAADGFLRDVATQPGSPAAGVAHRVNGITDWYAGDFVGAQSHLEQALAIFDPQRDADLAFRFGQDAGVGAMAYLSIVCWALGDAARARQLQDQLEARLREVTHVASFGYASFHSAMFEMMRGDFARCASLVKTLVDVAHAHDLAHWQAESIFLGAWIASRAGDPGAGLTKLREGATLRDERNIFNFYGLIKIALALEEARAGEIDAALVTLDHSLASSERTGQRCFDAETHRIRGEILLEQNPADSVAAEAALLAAIAVAQQQKARSFELRAALSLAKLYQSTGRPIDAHNVLGPALEGFSPTPEFPAITEAKALFDALAADEGVKVDAARRAQRLKLQTSYGQAVMWSKGFGADETLAAFARARELAAEGGADDDRYSIYYTQWLSLVSRGEPQQSRATAEAFLADAAAAGKRMETAVAHRILALSCFLLGDFAGANSHADRAVELDNSARSAESRFRFGVDCRICALLYLALANWQMGEVDEAIRLSQEALTQATTSGHVPTVANTGAYKAALDAARGDAEAAERTASMVFALSSEHGMKLFSAWSEMPLLWAQSRLRDRAAGASKLRQIVANLMAEGHRTFMPLYAGLLAELDAGGPDPNDAPTQIDAAIALAQQTGERWAESMLHRIRGEILVKRDPTNPAPAEEAFRTAIAIARRQGSRSFGLQAALALAKLHRSTARPADAHAVLAPALEGFAPTPEFPEIAEAIEFMASIKPTGAQL